MVGGVGGEGKFMLINVLRLFWKGHGMKKLAQLEVRVPTLLLMTQGFLEQLTYSL